MFLLLMIDLVGPVVVGGPATETADIGPGPNVDVHLVLLQLLPRHEALGALLRVKVALESLFVVRLVHAVLVVSQKMFVFEDGGAELALERARVVDPIHMVPISGIADEGKVTLAAVAGTVGAVDVLIVLSGLRERLATFLADEVLVTLGIVGGDPGFEANEGTLVTALVAPVGVFQE